MAGEWEGKSKGTVSGYKIFVFLIKKLGIGAAYTLLYFVAFYYFIFDVKSSKAMYYYYHKRQQYNFLKSLFSIYRSYYVFGQTLIDRTAIASGLRNKFTYEFDGIEHIKDLINQKKGGIMVSAHVGNFEIADFFFKEIDQDSLINLVTTDAEHESIKNYMESVTGKSDAKFIIVKEDMSHVFGINNALANGELICFTGDRYMHGSKTMRASLLGEDAKFPAGPFLLSSRLKVPVIFVYVMKEKNKHYHLYARPAAYKHRDAQGLLEQYTQSVGWMLKKYPTQWFNYFNFWKK